MKNKQELKDAIQNFWKNNDLDLKLDPSDTKILEWYIDKCLELLPNLYRELEEKDLLPENSTYHNFLQVFEFKFNEERHKAIFGDFL